MARFVFSALVLIHGLIHFMGFSKAFGFGNKVPISNAISKQVGILWLFAVLLFAIAAILVIARKDWWHIGAIAIVLSEILIISAWSDAKYGTVANIIILLVAITNFASWEFRFSARREAAYLVGNHKVAEEAVRKEDLELLPEPVKMWLTRSGVVGRPFAHAIRLKQKGVLRTTSDGKWMSMSAEQYFVTDSPSFLWLASIDYGMTHIAGRDKYYNGKGNMLIKMASLITVANANGKETDQGTMLRYLSEIQWFPSAALSPFIVWEPIDPLTAKATINYMGMSVTGTFFFNNDGDVVAFEAKRYMEQKGKYSLETWYVPVSEYRVFEGVRVPSKGSAIWKLRTGDFNWFNWEITEMDYNKMEVYNTK